MTIVILNPYEGRMKNLRTKPGADELIATSFS